MPEDGLLAGERDQRADAAALLLSAMQFAVYERNGAGGFAVVNHYPAWFLQLRAEGDGESPLTEHFPALEGFLPMAEEFWESGSAERFQSDFWTETDADGVEYHLLAYALTSGGRHFLALERADATYVEHQQLQLYAHEMVMQYETITRLNGEVERANRAKSDFLATMSHEIRTPLNAILGMADLLAESGLSAGQRKYVEVFQRAGGNLLGLINDILDLSKVEAGHLELEAVEFELAEVIGRVLELTRVKAGSKGLEVGSRLVSGLPAMLVGDPLRLRQILLNLLGNAMKFTEAGRLDVEVGLDPGGRGAGDLEFRVKDTGIGIASEKLGTIFENFSQADTSTTRKYGGTGLGLAISKRLVELMGGRIWVESVVGQGSTFVFTARFGVSDRIPEARMVEVRGADFAAQVRGVHLLLADDSEDNRFLIAEYLRNTPCELEMAEDGAIALGKMKAGHYDLVLMDAHMPNMDGYTATRAMRDWEREMGRSALPILALTADAFKESVEASAVAGFNAHLTKPISKATLMEAIRQYALVCELGIETVVSFEVTVDASVAALAPRYLKNMARERAALEAACEAEDYATMQRIGHNLHGTGTSFGFPRITELGEQIEDAAKAQAMDGLRAGIEVLGEYLDRVRIVQ